MKIFNKFDPRTKIIIVLLLTILIFLVDKIAICVVIMIPVFILHCLVLFPFKDLKFLKNLSMLVFFIIIVQTIFGPGENYIFNPLFPQDFPFLGGKAVLKWEGFILGLTISCRIAALYFLLPVFTATTPAYSIASGLSAFGINYRAAFIITTAFNLIPFFKEEAYSIMDAQKLRGMHCIERGSFFKKLSAYPGIVVPLVLCAMRKAQAVSAAMDCRAFGAYKTRTWIDKPKMKPADYFAIIACVVCSVPVFIHIIW